MNTSPQRRQTRKSSQTDQDAYVRLLSELTDDTENVPASTTSLILALLCSGYSWLCRLKNVFPLPLQTYSRQLYVLKMAGKMLLRCARAVRVLPTVFMATIFGFLAAVSFTWIWYPFILNSVIALIPTSIPAMDDADWSRSVLTATAIFATADRHSPSSTIHFRWLFLPDQILRRVDLSVKPCKPQYSTSAFVTVTAPVTMDESSQGSTASLESRLESRMESGQDSSDQSPPGREVRSKESPDISSNRKQSLSVDGFCDNRGREAQVPEGGRAHDAELKSDLVPVTMTQGSTVAALADCRSQTDEQEGEALDSMASYPDIVDGARDNFGEQPAFQAPSTPIGPTMRAQPTGQQAVQQTLSHQTELQTHAQHPSAQTGAYNHQLRSPFNLVCFF
ncbi:hypothetical protein NQ176_g7294 [Zarea fungicola]|uniref:Uncharacterized protein n=1 Tax=Zarea fungicola TaxID=93591 RepID=A0ACC1MYV8_9HYPO|nr:hypothetical protein NQ176_g7294 [Lecanicillium fungicola]